MKSKALIVGSIALTFSCGSSGMSPDACAGLCPAAPIEQTTLDALAKSLRLGFSILQNLPGDCPGDAPFGLCHDARLTLENQGPPSDARDWTIYWSNTHRVLRVDPGELELTPITGSLHAIAPSASYGGLAAFESTTLAFQAEGCWLAESEAMPRAYLAAPGLEPVVISNTDAEDASQWLDPLLDEGQTGCATLGTAPVASAGSRFEANRATPAGDAAAAAREIVPRPIEVIEGSGSIDLSAGLRVRASGLSPLALGAVSERLTELGVLATDLARPVDVSVDPSDLAFAGRPSAEAYHLSVATDGIRVVGGDAAGALHGLESLLALVSVANGSMTLPELQVPYDAPRYRYRGVQVDVARNFHGTPVLMRLLRQMAAYKLNALHLHLSDDEGFRLEIPGLPELTDVGARRCHDLSEQRCLLPQLGSGPRAETSGSGYLTRAELIALLRLAAALHIEVIPEFDLPGHARAAIRSMARRAGNGDARYLLHDPEDASEYRSVQGYTDNVANPCLESTFAFAATLMDEVASMYRDAGARLGTWHVGADEVPAGVWTRSPACKAFFTSSKEVRGASDLKRYFLRRINGLALERGLGLRVWSDAVSSTTFSETGAAVTVADPSDFAGNSISVNAYTPLRYYDDTLAPLAEAGYQVVLSSADYLYLDHAQEADPKERGAYWATRFTDLRKIFAFISGNPAANAALTPECADFACAYFFANAAAVTRPENIIGLEAIEWSEAVRTDEQLEAMLYPRLLAFAERAWHRAAWEPADGMDLAAAIDRSALDADFTRFANAVAHKELPRLDRAGVQYRIEVPGARITGGVLEANSPLPGLKLEYRNDAGEFAPYVAGAPPTLFSSGVRTVTSSGRAGREVPVSAPPSPSSKAVPAQPQGAW